MTRALAVTRSWRRGAIVAALAVGALSPPAAHARPQASLRVVDGTPAPATQFPYLATIKSGGQLSCGGSLIAPDRVLTAAHCLPDLEVGNEVTVGGTETRKIVHIAQDPQLTALVDSGRSADDVLPFDVGVLQLDAPITDIAPIRPAQAADAPLYAPGALLTTVGMGSTDRSGDGAGVLRFAQVQAQSDADCKSRLDLLGYARSFISAYMLCTTDPDNAPPYRSGCYGDSGTPLVALAPDGTPVQVGVDDWGVACGFHGGDPENYVEVASIADFALSPAPVFRPEPLGRPKLTGTVRAGRKVRCSTPAYNDPQPDQVAHGFFVLTAAGSPHFVARGPSYRIGRALRGRRLGCAVTAYSAGGETSTGSATVKRVR